MQLNSSGEDVKACSESWKNTTKWALTKTTAATTEPALQWETSNCFSLFYCFDWVLASSHTHILFSHRSHIKPKHIFFYSDWLWNVTSILSVQDAQNRHTHLTTHRHRRFNNVWKACFLVSYQLFSVYMTSSDDPHISIWIFRPCLIKQLGLLCRIQSFYLQCANLSLGNRAFRKREAER